METQLEKFIRNMYDKKIDCREDVNFFIAHTWKRDLKEAGLSYDEMTTKDFLNAMVNQKLTDVRAIIMVWEKIKSGAGAASNDISENIPENKKKKSNNTDNISYREYDQTDTHGNKIYSKGATIYLKLQHETRKLGVIDPKQKVFAIKRERLKHLFRKNNSYGFNHHFLSTPTVVFDKILLEDDYGKFLIPTKYILENAKFLNFLQKGFEKQVFLRLELIETFKQEEVVSVDGAEDETVQQ